MPVRVRPGPEGASPGAAAPTTGAGTRPSAWSPARADLRIRVDTDSWPPLSEAAPAPGATYLGVPVARLAGPTTQASGSEPFAGDAASSGGPSDFQAAHFQASSREAPWDL